MPWRNGAGVTLEIARAPAGAEPFDWRLSLASVAQSGPFSDFAGYQRIVALVEGRGFELDINGSAPARLDRIGCSAHFPGAAATHCALIDGPCSDVSLMVREPFAIEAARCVDFDSATRLHLSPQSQRLQALFCLQGRIELQHSDALELHDTLLLEPTAARDCSLSSRSAKALLLSWHIA